MRFVLPSHGGRGDIEPTVVVGRELQRRGHEVQVAVPPNLVDFVSGLGLPAIPYGADSRAMADLQRDYWTCLFRSPWRAKELDRVGRQIGEFLSRCWPAEENRKLAELAEGADLILGGLGFEQFAANVAECHNIPFATLQFYPVRANGQLLRFMPDRVGRAAMTAYEKLSWSGVVREIEDAQRQELGLPKAQAPWPQRIADYRSLEIQAYEQIYFPGLAAEWARFDGLRPFVGTLALELPTEADEEVLAWIAEGAPPIFFGFGSIPVGSAADTFTMIGNVCARLGQRALVAAGGTDTSKIPHFDHVKVVGAMNYATIFPACRAVVHHGGSGTLAAGLRAGLPTLVLWTLPDQPFFGAAVKRLKVGAAQRLSTTTEKSLAEKLGRILRPEYSVGARAVATRMSKPQGSSMAAADLVEDFARSHS
ncbi:glycosyltransferase [Mycolicibacterium rhodesiae]|uniref:Glycosyl transferase family 1 n=1 Tax=Mycolicibacterium rhodesiae TaxID=36814 RepID=A0A1X0IMC1_MYCRH|nr:glycosyltransferase [Mycolicibacterium rhodesiae]MCV7347633.1 glycosyltransferase [Mycolicibacterium rhodesiae]ORB49256.1 glycosyl transferase family 1 [Mycolicibacterium rhodesiae]